MSYTQFEEGVDEYSGDIDDEIYKGWEVSSVVGPAGHMLPSYVGGTSGHTEPNSEAGREQAPPTSSPSLPGPAILPDTSSPTNPSLPDPYHQQYNAVRQAISPRTYNDDTLDNAEPIVPWEAYQNIPRVYPETLP